MATEKKEAAVKSSKKGVSEIGKENVNGLLRKIYGCTEENIF